MSKKPDYKFPFREVYKNIDYQWNLSDYHYSHDMLITDYIERFYQGNKYQLTQTALERIVNKKHEL